MLRKISKSIRKDSGLAQIPLILGLLLMAIAIPIATRLAQQNQDLRNRAAVHPYCDPAVTATCNYNGVSCQPTLDGGVCVGIPTLKPTSTPATRYGCDPQSGLCRPNSSGIYTVSNCNNQCVIPTRIPTPVCLPNGTDCSAFFVSNACSKCCNDTHYVGINLFCGPASIPTATPIPECAGTCFVGGCTGDTHSDGNGGCGIGRVCCVAHTPVPTISGNCSGVGGTCMLGGCRLGTYSVGHADCSIGSACCVSTA
ncbi:hypothetical protein KKE47_05650, partial [Patescibacteria group bacterium]|nr:hypothetical protein [Patescibacteria group bacterium]